MTKSAASRIQSAGAIKNNGGTKKGSFEARAQSAGNKKSNSPKGK